MEMTNSDFIKDLRFNDNGLIPAISQDWLDSSILMMGWMNENSLMRTIQTGEAHYWSRSRKELWHKGATSGAFQIVKEIRFDCDRDVLLLVIDQKGSGACHKGYKSCFFNEISPKSPIPLDPPLDVCSEISKTINQRKIMPKEGSYTNELLKGGDNMILKKIGEESAEFVMACMKKNPDEIANEAADMIFHLQVALAKNEVSWRDVLQVLQNRKGAPRREA